MMVKKAAKSDRSGNQWEVFVIIRLRGLGLVRLVHRCQAFSQTCNFIKLSLPSAWNFHKMLQYWQRKAASLLLPTEWGWDVDCTLDIPYTYNGLDNAPRIAPFSGDLGPVRGFHTSITHSPPVNGSLVSVASDRILCVAQRCSLITVASVFQYKNRVIFIERWNRDMSWPSSQITGLGECTGIRAVIATWCAVKWPNNLGAWRMRYVLSRL